MNQKLADKKKKVKGAWEEVETSSDEEGNEEEKDKEPKKEEEKTMAEILAEYEAQVALEENKEREFLRKELKPDMYIEKILFTKFYKNN